MAEFNSALVKLHVATVVEAAVVGALKIEGSMSSVATRPGVVFFHPEQPLLGTIPRGRLGEAHLRLKVHDVAFMLRALRTAVTDVRPGAPEGGREPLTSRFPTVRMPEDRKVRRHCRRSFVYCVTYLSHVAHNLGLSINNDKLTVKQGRIKGMCIRKSRRLSIFCESRHKKPSTFTKKVSKDVQKGVNSALDKLRKEKWTERQSISTRMKSIKPMVPRKSSIFKKALKFLIKNSKRATKAAVNKKKVFTSISSMTYANKLELYRQTVTALQYMCWYTMHGVPYLANLLQCDSSDPERTKPDGDSRANDNHDPFGCALYSFCPNPCCGGLKEPSRENCWNRFTNPCRLHGLKGGRGCKIPREQNLNYNLLVDHGVQVSCDCGAGRRYEPATGKCVWRDHCSNPATACPKPHQHCFNMFGGHGCKCDANYRWSDYDQRCVPLYLTKNREEQEDRDDKEEKEEEERDELEEKMKDSPFFRWLNNMIDTSIKISPQVTPNYNWSLI